MDDETLSLFGSLERHLTAVDTATSQTIIDGIAQWLEGQTVAFAAFTRYLSALQQIRHSCEERVGSGRRDALQQVRSGVPEQAFLTVATACGWQRRVNRLKEIMAPAHTVQTQWLQALAHLRATLDRLPTDLANLVTPRLPPRLAAVLTREMVLRRLNGASAPWSVVTSPWPNRLGLALAAIDDPTVGPHAGPDFREEVEHEFARVFPTAT